MSVEPSKSQPSQEHALTKEEHRRNQKNKYAKERVVCECGMVYSKSNKARHIAIKYHQEWIRTNANAETDTTELSNGTSNNIMDVNNNVEWSNVAKQWQAVITINNKPKHLGFFDTKLEARTEFVRFVTEKGLLEFYRV